MRSFRATRAVLVLVLLGAGACQSAADREAPARDARRDIVLALETTVTEARVPPRATLESLLRQHDVPADLTAALVTSVRTVFNPRELRVDQTYRISRTLDGLLKEFRYQIDADRFLRVVRLGRPSEGEPAFAAEVVPVPRHVAVDAVTASISRDHSSLIGALDASGEGIKLALDLADLFGGVIDFNSDLQPGDRIDVLFERVTRGGIADGYGDIKAAVLEASGKRISAIRYLDADGKPGYYDDQGRSLKRQFLRSPLPFEPRVTSRFSYRRLHPVHGSVRAHLGVDYGAPIGTAVRSVAAGVVELAAWNGEAGRMVRVRHPGGYETAYLHLSSFAPGIRPGVRVDQGDLIGRVGMTGSATGPHLDYRIIKNGVYVNPLVELSRMPDGEPLAEAALPAFAALSTELLVDLRARVNAVPALPSAVVPGRSPK